VRIATIVTTAGIILFGTIAFAQSVTYDYDRAVDFSRFRTYAWTRGTNLEDELNHNRVVNAIEAQLAMKGLRRVESGERADLLVAYHASFDKNLQINASSSGWGPYGLGGSRFASARAEEILVGTLVVEMVDASTHSIVWRGLASTDVNVKASPEKREKNIHRAAEKLFRNYPPKAK
jgi:hypothetical protein